MAGGLISLWEQVAGIEGRGEQQWQHCVRGSQQRCQQGLLAEELAGALGARGGLGSPQQPAAECGQRPREPTSFNRTAMPFVPSRTHGIPPPAARKAEIDPAAGLRPSATAERFGGLQAKDSQDVRARRCNDLQKRLAALVKDEAAAKAEADAKAKAEADAQADAEAEAAMGSGPWCLPPVSPKTEAAAARGNKDAGAGGSPGLPQYSAPSVGPSSGQRPDKHVALHWAAEPFVPAMPGVIASPEMLVIFVAQSVVVALESGGTKPVVSSNNRGRHDHAVVVKLAEAGPGEPVSLLCLAAEAVSRSLAAVEGAIMIGQLACTTTDSLASFAVQMSMVTDPEAVCRDFCCGGCPREKSCRWVHPKKMRIYVAVKFGARGASERGASEAGGDF